MTTITTFLHDRIAEDEATARAASPAPWQYGDVESVAGGTIYDKSRAIASVDYEQPADHDGRIVRHLLELEADNNGRHITRWDPARVLAECEAKRKVLALHEAWPVLVSSPPKFEQTADPIRDMTFRATQQLDWLTNQEYVARFGDEPPTTAILRALALPYAEHPDFDEAWLS